MFKIFTFLILHYLFRFSFIEASLYTFTFHITLWCISILQWSYKLFVRTRLNIRKTYSLVKEDNGQSGNLPWAIVSDPLSKLGVEICKILAKEKFNLILIGTKENKSLLGDFSKEIQNTFFSNEIKKITIDCSGGETADYKQEINQLLSLNIAILVNNLEAGHGEEFSNLSLKDIEKIIHSNNTTTSILTRILIEHFLKRESKSAIINFSTTATEVVAPKFDFYTSSKKMIDFLSRALYEE